MKTNEKKIMKLLVLCIKPVDNLMFFEFSPRFCDFRIPIISRSDSLDAI